ncbi:hypothetical protein [Lysinibacillus capsici]|nr:hypothetical protein [Lysinibacillus capsici]
MCKVVDSNPKVTDRKLKVADRSCKSTDSSEEAELDFDAAIE